MTDLQPSPILEAVCEFRFSKDTEWPEDLVAVLYNTLKDTFPVKEDKKRHGFQVKTTENGLENPMVYSIENCNFLTEDRTILIQILPRMISVHCLRPYPSWEIFSQNIHLVFTTLQEITEIKKIDRIGLLYINKVEIDEVTVELDEYFNFYPHVSPGLPQLLRNFLVGCEFSSHDGADLSKLELTKTLPSKKDSNAFLLREEFYTAPAHSVKPAEAIEWIENAHNELKKLFEESVTEKFRELYRGTK